MLQYHQTIFLPNHRFMPEACKQFPQWTFMHLSLRSEQCFHFKSIHLEGDEWTIRYYDELIIRTFEQASIFITLPPGISVSQVLDKTEECSLREAFNYADPMQQAREVNASASSMKDQYTDATPADQFINGAGIPHVRNEPKQGSTNAASHSSRVKYCPPVRSRKTTKVPEQPIAKDAEMTPADTGKPIPFTNKKESPSKRSEPHTQYVNMECNITEKDSQSNSIQASLMATFHESQKSKKHHPRAVLHPDSN